MSVKNVIFAVAIILTCDSASTTSECRQLTPCSCVRSDGMGYNLAKLADEGTITGTKNGYTFYFQPCADKKIQTPDNSTESECMKSGGVSLCGYNSKTNKSENLGTAEDTKIRSLEGNNAIVTLAFFVTNDKKQNNTAIINLSCSNTLDKTSLDIVSTEFPYRFLLMSHLACETRITPKGLSTGSLLVILLFVFSGLYLFGGALTLKLLRGATGWEMLPNYAFWSDLPALVRDGIVFTFSGCKADSYDRI